MRSWREMDANGHEHFLEAKVVTPRGSALASYAYEPEDEVWDEPEEQRPMWLVRCSCGGSAWVSLEEDLKAWFRRHVAVAGIKL